MDEERAGYAEDFGLLFEGFGVPRMMGRVLGVLLISEEPELSAGELAEALQASRGSISNATRSLIQMGLLQRVSRPGHRRDYFRVKPDAWDELLRQKLEGIFKFRLMAQRGLNIVGSSGDAQADIETDVAYQNLEKMRRFFAYCEKELPALLERWEEDKEKEASWVQ